MVRQQLPPVWPLHGVDADPDVVAIDPGVHMSCRVDEVQSALSSDPECGPNVALFSFGEKCEERTLHQAHPGLHEHQLESAKKRMNSVLGENLGDLLQERQ